MEAKDSKNVKTVPQSKSRYFLNLPKELTREVKKYQSLTCDVATNNGKNCGRALEYTDIKGKTMNCSEYCKRRCEEWLPNLLFNVPKTVEIKTDIGKLSFEVGEVIIRFLSGDTKGIGNYPNFIYINRKYKDGENYRNEFNLTEGYERISEYDFKDEKELDRIAVIVCEFLNNYPEVELIVTITRKDINISARAHLISFNNNPNKRWFRGYDKWKVTNMYGDFAIAQETIFVSEENLD